MKKILLGLGSMTVAIIPIAVTISCGESGNKGIDLSKGFGKTIIDKVAENWYLKAHLGDVTKINTNVDLNSENIKLDGAKLTIKGTRATMEGVIHKVAGSKPTFTIKENGVVQSPSGTSIQLETYRMYVWLIQEAFKR